jgi:hypothetical protein
MSMTRFAIAATAAALVSVPACATNYTLTPVKTGPDQYTFSVFASAPSAGITSDTFSFDIPTDGFVSIGLLNVGTGTNHIAFNAATVTIPPSKAIVAGLNIMDSGVFSYITSPVNVPVLAGMDYVMNVTYTAGGPGAVFAGNVAFTTTAAVPEVGAWAMMILGFGFIGVALRYRRNRPIQDTVVRYS